MVANRWVITVVGLVVTVVVAVPLVVILVLAHSKWQADHPYGEIDGVLWRQVASSFDPLKGHIFSQEHIAPSVQLTPAGYVDALGGQRWDGTAGAASELGLTEGTAVIYDVTVSATVASFSAFISSGSRPATPRDDGAPYFGPDTLYTCLHVETRFAPGPQPTVLYASEQLTCPPALTEQLPADARYADPHAFNG